MTRKIAITTRQVTALCKGAAKAGYIPEFVLGDAVVRLVPEATAPSLRSVEVEAAKPWDHNVPWPGPDLNHREEQVLRVLVEAKGGAVPADTIPLAGSHTVNSLIANGLVGIEDGAERFDRRHHCIYATKEGLSFFKRREAHYKRYPSF